MRLGDRELLARDASGRLRWGSEAAGILFVGCYRQQRYALLALRSQEVMDPGTWGIPGGRVERHHADAYTAALVETQEELGPIPADVARSMRTIHVDEYKSGNFRYTTFVVLVDGAALRRWRPVLNWENDACEVLHWQAVVNLVNRGGVHPNLVRVLDSIGLLR